MVVLPSTPCAASANAQLPLLIAEAVRVIVPVRPTDVAVFGLSSALYRRP